jgi:hypothetical protein
MRWLCDFRSLGGLERCAPGSLLLEDLDCERMSLLELLIETFCFLTGRNIERPDLTILPGRCRLILYIAACSGSRFDVAAI